MRKFLPVASPLLALTLLAGCSPATGIGEPISGGVSEVKKGTSEKVDFKETLASLDIPTEKVESLPWETQIDRTNTDKIYVLSTLDNFSSEQEQEVLEWFTTSFESWGEPVQHSTPQTEHYSIKNGSQEVTLQTKPLIVLSITVTEAK